MGMKSAEHDLMEALLREDDHGLCLADVLWTECLLAIINVVKDEAGQDQEMFEALEQKWLEGIERDKVRAQRRAAKRRSDIQKEIWKRRKAKATAIERGHTDEE